MTRFVGVLALILLLLLAGCTSSDRTTKSEFIARGDQLCRGFNQSVEQVQVDTDPFAADISPAVKDQGLRFFGHLAGTIPELTNDLRNLGNPKDFEKVEKFLSKLEAAGLQFDKASRLYQAGDLPGAKANAETGFGQLETAGAAAQEYGFSVCDGREVGGESTNPTPAGPELPVSAKEYVFEFPAQVPAGMVTFAMKNVGQERHSFSLIKLRPGVSAQEVIDANKTGLDPKVLIERELGSSPRAIKDQAVHLAADLSSGSYAYACFIVAPDGQPHAYKGMLGEFRVP